MGAGVTAGMTTGLDKYVGHWGLLGFVSMSLVANLDIFFMPQFKKIMYSATEINDIHIFAGTMFRF
mgnify:CR=1 FL=1